MTRLREALGQPVVARDTAETLGELHGVVLDATNPRIAAVQVGKGNKARLADWSSVTGVGPDAVVVVGEVSLRPPLGEREEGFVKGDLPVLGGRVLTDRGDSLGALEDVEFHETTGELLALMAGDDTFDGSGLRSVGGYAMVVAADARRSGSDDAPLG